MDPKQALADKTKADILAEEDGNIFASIQACAKDNFDPVTASEIIKTGFFGSLYSPLHISSSVAEDLKEWAEEEVSVPIPCEHSYRFIDV